MDSSSKILIVEDEVAIRTGLVDVLVYHGYQVEAAASGREGMEKALSGRFDLLLLDVMLPEINGFEICHRLRQSDPELAIIMLTAKSMDEDVIQGLSLGADDYVTKPFSITQLLLRVQAVLRRTRAPENTTDIIHLSDKVTIDCLNLCGKRDEESLLFTRREIDLLRYLQQHGERPVSRDELLHKVWGYANNADLETRTVDIHIAKLRRKLEPEPSQPQFILTVRGAGYRLHSAAQDS
ncbi:MAG: response regulator transcription factor [Xanthomonadales bacterium]|nr:response regulator transcription factor [Xanthomonadales bacterium]